MRSSWIYNKDLAHREIIDQELMWQESFGIDIFMDTMLFHSRGVFSPKKMNETCSETKFIGLGCPGLRRFLYAGQLSKDAGTDRWAKGPASLAPTHFRSVRIC